jgi:carboxymethylenebutenolidase
MSFALMLDSPDGRFGAYVAHPQTANGRALVVIQEIFGVNDAMKELADHYATHGYIAIVPDLFWRIKPGINITDKTPEEMTQAFDLFGKFDVAKGVEDIQTTLNYARSLSPKVGAVGYCLGGLLAYLTACQTDADASVSYYGVSIDQHTDQLASLTRPLMLHVASEDGFVSKDAQKAISKAVADNSLVELHTYEGLDHAFARPGGDHFDAAGSALASARTLAFFETHLS